MVAKEADCIDAWDITPFRNVRNLFKMVCLLVHRSVIMFQCCGLVGGGITHKRLWILRCPICLPYRHIDSKHEIFVIKTILY